MNMNIMFFTTSSFKSLYYCINLFFYPYCISRIVSYSFGFHYFSYDIIYYYIIIYCADVVGASYYDSSLRWFENINGTGVFMEHMISDAVREGQGVTLADIDK